MCSNMHQVYLIYSTQVNHLARNSLAYRTTGHFENVFHSCESSSGWSGSTNYSNDFTFWWRGLILSLSLSFFLTIVVILSTQACCLSCLLRAYIKQWWKFNLKCWFTQQNIYVWYIHTFDYCYTCTTYTGMLTLSLVLTILFYIYINVAVCLWDFYFLLKNDCAFRISQDAFCGLRGIIKHGHQSVLTLWQSLLIYWCLTDSESLIVRLRSVKNCLILSTYHFSVRSFLIVT